VLIAGGPETATHTTAPKPQAQPEIRSLYQRGHGNWERYEGPQSIGLQAVSGFPAQLLVAGAAPGKNTTFTIDENKTNIKRFLFLQTQKRGRLVLRPLTVILTS
jgi:hypothetical protein